MEHLACLTSAPQRVLPAGLHLVRFQRHLEPHFSFGVVGLTHQRLTTLCRLQVCTSCESNETVNLGVDKATGGCAPCTDANCNSCSETNLCTFCKVSLTPLRGLAGVAVRLKPCRQAGRRGRGLGHLSGGTNCPDGCVSAPCTHACVHHMPAANKRRAPTHCVCVPPMPPPFDSQDGFGVDEKTGACTACPANAQSCSINATGTFIDTCNKGYGPAKGGKECQVRFVAGSSGSGDVRLGPAMHAQPARSALRAPPSSAS